MTPLPKSHRARSESLWRAIGGAYTTSVIGRVADMLTYVVLLSCLAPSLVGTYLIVVATVQIANEFLTWGVDRSLLRDFSSGRVSLRAAAPTYLLSRVPAGIVALLISAGALFAAGDRQASVIVLLVGGAQILQNAESAWSIWLRGCHFQVLANGIAAAGSLARLGIAALLLLGLGVGLAGLLAAYLVLAGISLTINCLVALRLSSGEPARERQRLIPSLKSGTAFAVTGLMTVGQNRLDWLLVAAFISPSALAVYGLANKVYELIQVVVGTGLGTIYPYLCRSRLDGRGGEPVHLALKSLVLVAGLLAVLAGLLVGPVALTHLPAEYRTVQAILPLFLVAAVVSPYAGILYQVFASLRQDRWLVGATAAGTVLQLLANLTLIPAYGARGGAAAMIVLVVVTSLVYTAAVFKLRLLALRRLADYALGAGLAAVAVGLMTAVDRLVWAAPLAFVPLVLAVLTLLSVRRLLPSPSWLQT